MSIFAVTLSISIIVFILLSLTIIFCLRSRQKHFIDAYNRANNARLSGGHVRITDQDYRDRLQAAAFEKTDSLSSYTLTGLPRSSRVGGPPSWTGSLELHHSPSLGRDANSSNGVVVAMAPERARMGSEGPPLKPLPWPRPLRRGATFPVAQFDRTDPFLTAIAESPILRSISTPPLRTKTATITTSKNPQGPHPPLGKSLKGSPDSDKTSITEWPCTVLEPTSDPQEKSNRAKGRHTRRLSRGSGNYQSLVSIINLAMRGPTTGNSSSNSNSNKQGSQRQPSTLNTQSRSPGIAPEFPAPPIPAKTNDHSNYGRHHDIFSVRRKGFPSWRNAPLPRCPESFSSLQTTSSSILETAKYTDSGTHSRPLPSSPPNFSSSPLSSRTSLDPSIFDGMTTDFGTPPAMGLTSPSVARMHRKQLSYGASQNTGGRRSQGLRQSAGCGGRMLMGGSLVSLATLGRTGKEGEREGEMFYFSSSPPGGVLLPDSPSKSSNTNNAGAHETGTLPSTASSPTTPSCKPDDPLNQNHSTHSTPLSLTNTPEIPSSHRWAATAVPMDNSSDPRSLFHWDFRSFPTGPHQPPPTKKGHRRQNCIRISYSPTEPSTPQHRTLLSPIASVSDHPPTSTPRLPSSSNFLLTPVEDCTVGTKRKKDFGTLISHLGPTQSETDLSDSPTFAMMNYYSAPPSPTHDCHSSSSRTGITPGGNGSNAANSGDVFLTRSAVTPPQLKSLKEPSPPLTHRSYIPFSPIAISENHQSQQPAQSQAQTQQLRFSVLALRRMNSDISTTATATTTAATTAEKTGGWGYLNLGGPAAIAEGIASTTNAVSNTDAGGGNAVTVSTSTSNTRPLSHDPSFSEGPPRKIARVSSTTAAAAVGRRRRMTIGALGRKVERGGKGGEGVVGLGVDVEEGVVG
ncbi:MAG: hypothetical protein M1839_002781 [Geoglossum umbratile]|nr:MAG: hypothetical protein M1839_002781 [Geoglossum umbratile]